MGRRHGLAVGGHRRCVHMRNRCHGRAETADAGTKDTLEALACLAGIVGAVGTSMLFLVRARRAAVETLRHDLCHTGQAKGIRLAMGHAGTTGHRSRLPWRLVSTAADVVLPRETVLSRRFTPEGASEGHRVIGVWTYEAAQPLRHGVTSLARCLAALWGGPVTRAFAAAAHRDRLCGILNHSPYKECLRER